MVEFKWIKMSLFLIAVLQFTAAEKLSFTVRDGDDVTLPCENVKDGQPKCGFTVWLFSSSGSSTAVELVKLGQIGENAKSKSDRLSVTANCSLVIKKVTIEDVGRYFCQQYKSGEKESPDAEVYLSLITMTKQKDADKVTLSCSVSTYRQCGHTVKWLFQGQDVNKNNNDMKTSQSPCSDSVNFQTSHYISTSRYDLLKCEVTDGYTGKVQLFPFRLRPSGEKPGEDSITTTKPTTTENNIKTGTTTTASATTDASPQLRARTDCSALNYIMLVMRVAELVLITVITVLLIRARGNQRPPDDDTVLNSVRSRTVKRSGAAASQVHRDEDEDDGVVNYKNFGDPSASVRLR